MGIVRKKAPEKMMALQPGIKEHGETEIWGWEWGSWPSSWWVAFITVCLLGLGSKALSK